SRNEDVVNHVFGGHDQFDLAAHRDVQLVDLTLTRRVLELPHPLLADHINFQSVLGWSRFGEVNLGPPDKYGHRDQQWDHRPERFQFRRAFDRPRNFKSVAAAITNHKED